MKQQQVLIVEDDEAIRQGIVDALRFKGYATLQAGDGDKGLQSAVSADCDLLLLDLVLPRRGGLEILREVRSVRPTLPVIIITARGDESERVEGLQLGADDYVVKPFSIKELLARIEAVLRRSPERPGDVKELKLPGGLADLARREVRFDDGARTELSETEAGLLRYFACNPGRAISRDELLSRVWRFATGRLETRAVDMHIARLRKKLRDDPANPAVIMTVRGKGYVFAAGGNQQ